MTHADGLPGAPCRFCSYHVPAGQMLCASCGRFGGTQQRLSAPKGHSTLAKINACLARIEAYLPNPWTIRKDENISWLGISNKLSRAIGVTFILLGSIIFFNSYVHNNNWFSIHIFIAFWMIGLIALFPEKALKSNPQEIDHRPNSSTPALHFWKTNTNLLYVQAVFSVLSLYISFCLIASTAHFQQARFFALLGVSMPLLLKSTSARISSWMLAFVCAIYLMADILRDDGYALITRDLRKLAYTNFFTFTLEPIIWTTIVLSLIPQVRVIGIGNLSPGSFKGDFSVTIFGAPVYIFFGSAVVLFSSFKVITVLPFLHRWLFP